MEDNRPYRIPRPKGLRDYILKNCAKETYLIFSTKHNIAACTRCGAEFPLEEVPDMQHRPNAVVHPPGAGMRRCPRCGTLAAPKDIRYGRKCLTDFGRVVWTRAYGAVTFIEVDEFIIGYGTPHPGVSIAPIQMIRLDAKSQERWDYDYYYGNWAQVKTINLKAAPQIYGISEWHDHLYRPDGKSAPVGTDLQYANVDPARFDRGEFDENWMIIKMIRYMSEFLKYPAIEILEKSGFENIVLDRAAGSKSKYMNLRAKDLRKILKVDGADVKRLRKEEPHIAFLHKMHQIRKLAPWAQIEDIEELDDICGRYIQEQKMRLIETHADVSKVMARLLEETRATGDTITLSDYADYLEAVHLLGVRLDKKTLYPRNFMEAHDEAVAEADTMKGKLESANFARFQKEITGMTDPFIMGPLMIRPAASPQELNRESRALNHCVRTYVDRVARGTTSILFIRKTEAPEKPYYTLELDCSGRVVQCRGDHNCTYPDEVAVFIDQWMKWRKKERITA